MLTVMGILARRHGWPLEGTNARIEKHMSEHPPRRVARLVARISMPVELPEQARAPLERVARSCPVFLSLHSETEVDLRFDWGSAGVS